MNILITGSNGFIGKNIVEKFNSTYNIFSPKRENLDLLDSNSTSKYIKDHSIDTIIHCAIQPGHRNSKNPSNQLYNNMKMFFNIARNSASFHKMIFLSSGLVYDQRAYKPKMKEDYFDNSVPMDEGGFSKYIISQYIKNTENILELRPFGVFGKYEDYAIRFISNAICKSIFNLPITIKQNRHFDYIYIDDLIKVIEYFFHRDSSYKQYNVTPNQSMELVEIANMVKRISQKDISIIVKNKGLGDEYSGDNSRLKTELGKLNLIPMENAIQDLYGWYLKNTHLINKELLLTDK